MNHHSDDDADNHPNGHATKGSSTLLNFDDAFSDSDDNDVSLEFSAAAIRKELAKSLDGFGNGLDLDDMDAITSKIGYSVDPVGPDASVSTFDIDARNEESLPPSAPQSPSSPSQVLSQSSSHQDSLYDVPLSSDNSHSSLAEQSHSPSAHDEEHITAYPAVEINVSDPHPFAVQVKAPLPDDGPIYQQHAASHEEFRVKSPPSALHIAPLPETAASTSSLPLPSSSSLPTPTTPKFSDPAAHHRPTRSMGPSALDKVISKTRPPYLPPKKRSEDRKHMADWETMMKRSRAAEEKRRKALQERRIAREQEIEESIEIWEREIVPDWTVVKRNPALRRLWWQGIPTKLRTSMWQYAIGNDLALSKDSFKICLSRAKRALASGTFPTTVLGLLEDDISTTLPSIHLFLPGAGPLYQDLKDMLCAWVVARSDEGLGYVTGVAKIAAMILINMAPSQGFIVMRNLLERHCMRSFYGGMASKDDVEAYYRIFDTLLADGMPKIYFNFKQHQISPAAYLPEWLIPLFLDHLPFEACARVWDVILLEGDSFLYRAALAILGVMEPRLFFPDRNELLELLSGKNKAALEVAKREQRILNNGKYEIYGVDEESLWERISSMDEWWRESTWKRLIERELPDL